MKAERKLNGKLKFYFRDIKYLKELTRVVKIMSAELYLTLICASLYPTRLKMGRVCHPDVIKIYRRTCHWA